MAVQVGPTGERWDGSSAGLVGEQAPDQAGGPPARLGAYRLIHQLGEGGMGVVHLALDPHGRAVAIKVLRPHIAYDPEARTRLEREVDTLSRIRDHRVAAVIDSDIFGPRPFLVTRYVAGPALDEVVATHGPLRGPALLRLGRGLAGALDAIHAVGVVHRDLKPGNVLLEDEDPVVIDFGIAHIADDVRLTSVGLVMGTPGYLSPEVIEGASVTEATDWWGWAATLAFAASGHPPFGRGPMEVVLSRVRRGECDLTGVDARLQPLLQAALSPDQWRRPPAAQVVAALERYADGGPATVAVPGVPTGYGATAPVPAPAPLVSADDYWDAEPLGWDVPLPEESRQRRGWRRTRPEGSGTSELPQAEAAGPAWSPPVPQPVAQPVPSAEPYSPSAPSPAVPRQDPRIGRPQRTGTLAALAALGAAAGAGWPLGAVLVAVVWCWAARFCDRSVTALVVRRFERGERRTDVARSVAAGPWHLVVGAVATVAGLALPAVVAASTTVCATLGLTAATSASAAVAVPPALALGFLTGAFVAWWGPGGASLRRGSRSLVRGLAPTGTVGGVVVGVVVAAALALVVVSFVRHGQVVWWPLSGDPLRAFGPFGS